MNAPSVVELATINRLYDGQQPRHGQGGIASASPSASAGHIVPTINRHRQHCAADLRDDQPDPRLPAFKSDRRSPAPGIRAGLARGFAVALAPGEGPFGKALRRFFPVPSSRPLETLSQCGRASKDGPDVEKRVHGLGLESMGLPSALRSPPSEERSPSLAPCKGDARAFVQLPIGHRLPRTGPLRVAT